MICVKVYQFTQVERGVLCPVFRGYFKDFPNLINFLIPNRRGGRGRFVAVNRDSYCQKDFPKEIKPSFDLLPRQSLVVIFWASICGKTPQNEITRSCLFPSISSPINFGVHNITPSSRERETQKTHS